jgi:hypothetical protein
MKIAFLIVGPAAFFAGATAFAALVFIDVTSEAFKRSASPDVAVLDDVDAQTSKESAPKKPRLSATTDEKAVSASTSSRTATSGEAERLRGAVDAGRAGCKGPVILER